MPANGSQTEYTDVQSRKVTTKNDSGEEEKGKGGRDLVCCVVSRCAALPLGGHWGDKVTGRVPKSHVFSLYCTSELILLQLTFLPPPAEMKHGGRSESVEGK